MKRLLIAVGGLVLLVVIAVVFIFSSLDSLITQAVETFGSEITRTEVTLKETRVSATTGEGVLVGFNMSNPSGFQGASAVKFGEIRVALDVESLAKDPIVVKEIIVSAPEISYEQGARGSNFDAIRNNVNSYLGTGKGTAEKPSGGGGQPSQGGADKGKKLIIEKLVIQDGRVNASATAIPGKTLTVNLPAIRLNNLGKGKGGASAGEVVNTIIKELNQQVTRVVQPLDLGDMQKQVDAVASKGKELLEKGAKDPQQLIETTKDLGKTVEGLFGN